MYRNGSKPSTSTSCNCTDAETPEFCRSVKEEGLKSGHALQIIKAFGVAPDEPFPHTEDYEADCDFSYSTRVAPRPAAAAGRSIGMSCKTTRTYALLPERRHRIGQCGPSSQLSHPAWAGVDLNSRFETTPALKDVGLLADFIKDLRE